MRLIEELLKDEITSESPIITERNWERFDALMRVLERVRDQGEYCYAEALLSEFNLLSE